MMARAGTIGPVIVRLLIFGGAWLVLTEGSTSAPLLGLAAVAVTTAASLWLHPPRVWHWTAAGFGSFLWFFFHQSVAGGLDVARRALLPRVPLAPAFVEYAVRLPDGPARRFFAGAIGLLPGSLTAQMGDTHLLVHVLDHTMPVTEMLRRLEDHTAALFGLPPLD